jgi:hypothetical protein
MSTEIEYVICAVCGSRVAGYVPKGGDGSLLFTRYHKRLDGQSMMISRYKRIKCEGSNRESAPEVLDADNN